jgi:hypothetical protein
MKKMFFIIAAVVVSAGILFNSCEKERPVIEQQSQIEKETFKVFDLGFQKSSLKGAGQLVADVTDEIVGSLPGFVDVDLGGHVYGSYSSGVSASVGGSIMLDDPVTGPTYEEVKCLIDTDTPISGENFHYKVLFKSASGFSQTGIANLTEGEGVMDGYGDVDPSSAWVWYTADYPFKTRLDVYVASLGNWDASDDYGIYVVGYDSDIAVDNLLVGDFSYESDFSSSTDGWTCSWGATSGNFGYASSELTFELTGSEHSTRPVISKNDFFEESTDYNLYIEGDGVVACWYDGSYHYVQHDLSSSALDEDFTTSSSCNDLRIYFNTSGANPDDFVVSDITVTLQ